MKSLYYYFKERFPFFPLFVYSFLTISGISNKIQIHTKLIQVLLLSIVYTSFLFHLRILDEFKDFEYDSKHHPGRPIQKGTISLSKIKIIGIINFFILLFASVTVTKQDIVLLILFVMIYSLLMFKEFFIKNFYEKSATLYLISHQIVFIPLFLFFYSSLITTFWFPDNLPGYSLFIYTLIPIVLIEIGRKMKYRFDKHGRKTDDTYLFIWGERRTINIFSALVVLSGLLSFSIQNFNWLISSFILTLGLFLTIGGFLFPKKIIKFNMMITIFFALGLPALLLI